MYSALELEERGHLDKTLLNCSVDLDLGIFCINKQGVNFKDRDFS